MLNKFRLWRWKRAYSIGKIVTRFIAPDIRRDVDVVDTSEIESGVITVRTRTWNVLYHIKEIKEKPPFGDVRRIEIRDLWKWEGELWGGPVPDSTDRKA
jgi:hypothetical protein